MVSLQQVSFNLAWEVFNTNSARFDVHSAYSESTDGRQIGEYTGLLGSGAFGAPPSRRMQLSGRFEFKPNFINPGGRCPPQCPPFTWLRRPLEGESSEFPAISNCREGL